MLRCVNDLWHSEIGASTGLEWMLVAEMLVLGSIIALLALQRATLGG